MSDEGLLGRLQEEADGQNMEGGSYPPRVGQDYFDTADLLLEAKATIERLRAALGVIRDHRSDTACQFCHDTAAAALTETS